MEKLDYILVFVMAIWLGVVLLTYNLSTEILKEGKLIANIIIGFTIGGLVMAYFGLVGW